MEDMSGESQVLKAPLIALCSAIVCSPAEYGEYCRSATRNGAVEGWIPLLAQIEEVMRTYWNPKDWETTVKALAGMRDHRDAVETLAFIPVLHALHQHRVSEQCDVAALFTEAVTHHRLQVLHVGDEALLACLKHERTRLK